MGDRPGIRSRNRLPDPGRDQASRGGWPMTNGRRVVITGIGAVTPIGHALEGFWSGLKAERSAVRTITRFDPSPFRTHVAAEINDFDPVDFLGARRAKRLDRCSALSLAAGKMALDDARIRLETEDKD